MPLANTMKKESVQNSPSRSKMALRAESFIQKQDYKKAEPLFEKICKTEPGDLESLFRYGECLYQNDKLQEALTTLARVSTLLPRSDVFTVLGNVQMYLSLNEQAKTSFETAISLDGSNHKAWAGLALNYNRQSQPEHALLIMNKAHELAEAENSEEVFLYCHYVGDIFKKIKIVQFNDAYKAILLKGLTSEFSPLDYYYNAWTALLRMDTDLYAKGIEKLTRLPYGAFKTKLDAMDDNPVFTDPYFYNGIDKLIMVNTSLEDLCRNLRNYFLEKILKDTLEEKHKALLFALASQCFFNEYLFSFSEEEEKQVSTLRDEIENNAPDSIKNLPEKLASLGSYINLNQLKNAADIEKHCRNKFKNNERLQTLIRTQITEPATEQKIKSALKTIGSIGDDVSQKVRAQYEVNPYPRWKSFAKIVSTEHTAFSRNFKNTEQKELLIAGCGTGRQIAMNKTSFPSAHFTVVDISRASLAYAKRKCDEMGYDDIKFYHADLLDVGQIGKKFDIIACTGVLHHMEDPLKGWHVLTNVLRPGGYMFIGLYSEIARSARGILEARETIAKKGFDSSPEGIRACREYIKSLPDSHSLRALTKSHDFFSISATRDLIFHVQEQRYTIERLKKELDHLGLRFSHIIFSDTHVKKAYENRFPDDPHGKNLDNIGVFERENPSVFMAMYQFWVHKPE